LEYLVQVQTPKESIFHVHSLLVAPQRSKWVKTRKKSLKIISMKKPKTSFAIDVESANEYVQKELDVNKGLDVIGIRSQYF